MLILGNSVLEGVGTALLIPPVYIITTLASSDLTSRARALAVISGMGGIGLVSDLASGNTSNVLALVTLGILAIIGLAAAVRLPADTAQPAAGHG